jgi:hypothetical protein
MRYIQCLKTKNGLDKDFIYEIYNVTSNFIIIIVNGNKVIINKNVKPEVNDYFKILTKLNIRKIKLDKLNNKNYE